MILVHLPTSRRPLLSVGVVAVDDRSDQRIIGAVFDGATVPNTMGAPERIDFGGAAGKSLGVHAAPRGESTPVYSLMALIQSACIESFRSMAAFDTSRFHSGGHRKPINAIGSSFGDNVFMSTGLFVPLDVLDVKDILGVLDVRRLK
ncbi:MAG: hypothetical protein U0Q18_25460 [Bryobacteraceae bacterium]